MRGAFAPFCCAAAALAQPLEITPPRPIGAPVLAEYPPGAAGAARVVLEVDIDARGEVSAVRVATPAQPGFDEAALAAARKLRFEPALQGGQPVAVRIQYAFNFVEKPPAPSLPSRKVGTKFPTGNSSLRWTAGAARPR
jgi:TonB family protein